MHDTIEDTDTSVDELIETFGAPVASLVQEVTDDKRLPKAERKLGQVAAPVRTLPSGGICTTIVMTAATSAENA